MSALIGVYQYMNHIGLYYAREGILRISGPDTDANIYAMSLTLFFVIVLNVFLGLRNWRIKSVLLGIIILLLCTIVMTFSRAGMIQLSVGLWLSVGIRLLQKYKIAGVVVFLLIIMFMIPFIPHKYFERMGTVLNFRDQAIAARFEGWRLGLSMIADHPFKGVGFGVFRYEFLERSLTGIDTHFKRALDAHNLFIHTAAETGIVGLMFLLLLIGEAFRNLYQAIKNFRQQEDVLFSSIANGLRIGLLVYLVGGIFISYLELLIFWIIIPFSVALRHLSEQREVFSK
ncbi:MAG: O-antigen ligase family protein [Ignavibacteriales bacterium]|nr:O-antigen ligase family protein [Ignavibacteriales bacterium]